MTPTTLQGPNLVHLSEPCPSPGIKGASVGRVALSLLPAELRIELSWEKEKAVYTEIRSGPPAPRLLLRSAHSCSSPRIHLNCPLLCATADKKES